MSVPKMRVPKMRVPKMTRAEIQAIIDRANVASPIVIVGIRGYYLDSMGAVGANDRGIYDDALFVVSPTEFQAFQANVDPSIFRRGIGTLKIGVYDVVKWIHHGKYAALQIVKDTLIRDGETGEDCGRHGVNFHHGSDTETWSEGCQTLPKAAYQQFLNLIYQQMNRCHLDAVKYVLIDNPQLIRKSDL